MFRRRMLWPLALAALTLVACCPLIPVVPPGEVLVSEDDDGKTIAVHTGQTLVVALGVNLSTGFQWEVQAADPAILVLQAEPEYSGGIPGIIGSGGTQRFRLAVVGPGRCRLTLVYRRPWETGIAPIRTFGVDIVVEGAPVTPAPRP